MSCFGNGRLSWHHQHNHNHNHRHHCKRLLPTFSWSWGILKLYLERFNWHVTMRRRRFGNVNGMIMIGLLRQNLEEKPTTTRLLVLLCYDQKNKLFSNRYKPGCNTLLHHYKHHKTCFTIYKRNFKTHKPCPMPLVFYPYSWANLPENRLAIIECHWNFTNVPTLRLSNPPHHHLNNPFK